MYFKVSSFLYLKHEDYQHDFERIEKESQLILEDHLSNFFIRFIEHREENGETAVKFDVYIEANSKEEAENIFLDSLKDYDVDNYVVLG